MAILITSAVLLLLYLLVNELFYRKYYLKLDDRYVTYLGDEDTIHCNSGEHLVLRFTYYSAYKLKKRIESSAMT